MEKKLNETSTEELLKNKKTLIVITGLLAVVLVILLIKTIYSSVTKGYDSLIAVPLALSPIVIINYKKIRDIQKELQSRNN